MMKKRNKTKTINETQALRRLGPFGLAALSDNKTTAGALALLLLASQASAASFIFSTGDPDGKIATLSRPSSPGKIQTETADDFVVTQAVVINRATFTGLLPLGATLTSISDVEIELYHVFSGDSDTNRVLAVPTRANSPGDVEIDDATRDSADGSLTFSATIMNPSFSVLNSVVNGINKHPNEKTNGEGPVTGEEVLIIVEFNPPISLPADHYFFRPEVRLSSGDFLWLSAPKPMVAPGTPFAPDLQSWIRNDGVRGAEIPLLFRTSPDALNSPQSRWEGAPGAEGLVPALGQRTINGRSFANMKINAEAFPFALAFAAQTSAKSLLRFTLLSTNRVPLSVPRPSEDYFFQQTNSAASISQTAAVLGSADLAVWSALGVATNSLGSINFTDVTANLSPQKFYRALMQGPPPNMVFIPPNTFTMGSPTNEQDRSINEGPQTTVTLSRGFWTIDPSGPASSASGRKVVRGGAFDNSEQSSRSAARSLFPASRFLTDSDLGFRVVLVTGPQ